MPLLKHDMIFGTWLQLAVLNEHERPLRGALAPPLPLKNQN